MRVWRICRRPFANLSGEGARLYGGRWNSPGRPAVYTADSAALAVLEVRVHLDLTWDLLPDDFVLVEIDTGAAAVETATTLSNPLALGDSWLDSGRSPLLNVPSVIVPESRNIIINPTHPAAASIRVVSIRSFAFDPRLWRPNPPASP